MSLLLVRWKLNTHDDEIEDFCRELTKVLAHCCTSIVSQLQVLGELPDFFVKAHWILTKKRSEKCDEQYLRAQKLGSQALVTRIPPQLLSSLQPIWLSYTDYHFIWNATKMSNNWNPKDKKHN